MFSDQKRRARFVIAWSEIVAPRLRDWAQQDKYIVFEFGSLIGTTDLKHQVRYEEAELEETDSCVRAGFFISERVDKVSLNCFDRAMSSLSGCNEANRRDVFLLTPERAEELHNALGDLIGFQFEGVRYSADAVFYNQILLFKCIAIKEPRIQQMSDLFNSNWSRWGEFPKWGYVSRDQGEQTAIVMGPLSKGGILPVMDMEGKRTSWYIGGRHTRVLYILTIEQMLTHSSAAVRAIGLEEHVKASPQEV